MLKSHRKDPEPPESTASRPDPAAALQRRIRACRICVDTPHGAPLPHQPRPILRLSSRARLAVASQAPGTRAHASGIPFDDASGERLRAWMALDRERFLDPDRLVIAPMGFCFPGNDAAGGDLPPRRECRAHWHDEVFAAMPQLELILVIGLHALRYHMRRLRPDLPRGRSLTEWVRDWRDLYEGPGSPRLIPLPHPSWRNSGWLKRHPWFESDLLPLVRAEVRRLAGDARSSDPDPHPAPELLG